MTPDIAMHEVRRLDAEAVHHKREAAHHRRKAREVRERQAQIRAECARLGIEICDAPSNPTQPPDYGSIVTRNC